jgi:hypothetical protein
MISSRPERSRGHLEARGNSLSSAKNNRGNALLRLGSGRAGPGKLEEALAAYREVLKEFTSKAASKQNMALCLALVEQRRKKNGCVQKS